MECNRRSQHQRSSKNCDRISPGRDVLAGAHIEMLWPKGPETVATLNIGGPNPTYVDYISAQVQKYIYLVQMHEKLAFMRDTVKKVGYRYNG